MKRTPSTGSIGSLSSARSVQSEASSTYSRRTAKLESRESRRRERELVGDSDDDGQDIKFIDCDTARTTQSAQSRTGSARKEKKTLSTQDIVSLHIKI